MHECIRARAYETRATYTTGKGRAVYTKKDIDFIAAHVVPLDLWYIIPVEVCEPAPMLRFYPHRQARIMRLEPYREAWNLILPRKSNHVMEIKACADERYSNPCHSDRREESAFGLQHPDADPDLVIYRDLIRRTPTTTVQQSLAAWPIPPLKILMTREGKRLLEKI